MERQIKYPPSRGERNWKELKRQVHNRLLSKAEKRNNYHKVVMKEFKVGQRVMIRQDRISSRSKRRSAKLSQLFTGPVMIRKRLGINTYMVKMKGKRRIYRVHNISNLYPYVTRSKNMEGDQEVLGSIKMLTKKNSSVF